MAETLTIRTASSTEIVKIAVPGPQGPKGDKGDPGDVAGLPLTTQGDTLYRGASENQRLPIGTSGQILKVSAGGIPEWGAAPATGVTSVTGTAPIASSGGNTPAISISEATTSAAGSMSAADKTKLDGIASGAEVNVQSNWTEADSGSDAFILNKPSTFTPTAHAASHSAGTKAQYNDQVAGMTENVFIRADNAGTAGNSITLTFDGADDIDTVLSAWNAANSSNTATLILGDGSQVPDNGEEITLSGGVAGGSDPFKNINQNLGTTDTPVFDGLVVARHGVATQLAVGNHVANFVAANGSADAPLVLIGGTGNIEIFKDSAISKALAYGFAVPSQSATDDFIVSLYDGSWAEKFRVAQDGTATIKGNIVLRDNDGNQTATFDAQSNLTANRTYDLPDRSGELMIVGDAPASHTHGTLTNDGKLGATAGLPVVTTTAGAVTTLALGTAGQVLTVNSGATGVEFAAASGGGVTGAASSASDVLGVSGANITGVDAGAADRLVFWDDSANRLTYLEAGSGLTISGTVMTASGGASINQAIAVGFVLN